MSKITRFDDLSPELILCLFDYLSSTDRYKAFFDYNARLRVLVKKYTEFSRKDLNSDIRRFSTLHSWYKHLSFEDGGTLYFIMPRKGQQPRYDFDPRVTDSNGIHWWFVYHTAEKDMVNERVRDIITRHPIRLTPFFYHAEHKSSNASNNSRSFYGGHIIVNRYDADVKLWLNSNYPKHAGKTSDRSDPDWRTSEQSLVPIFDGEWLKTIEAINKAATQIWNELKEIDDINPLEIEF